MSQAKYSKIRGRSWRQLINHVASLNLINTLHWPLGGIMTLVAHNLLYFYAYTLLFSSIDTPLVFVSHEHPIMVLLTYRHPDAIGGGVT